MEERICDCVVIGGGPAGMTAGIYMARANKKVVILENEEFGGQIALTTRVENYPGAGSIDGKTLSKNMLEDLVRSGAEIITEKCIRVDLCDDIKKIYTENFEFQCRSVILAMGVRPRQINSKVENKFKGNGLSYSATSDGEYYSGKKVAVVGGGKSAFVDALYMTDIADSVMLVHRTDKFRVTDKEIEDAKNKGVQILPYHIIREIVGEERLQKVVFVNTLDGVETTYNLDALFISAGRVPNTELIAGVIETDDSGYIKSEDCTTNIEGVYACGDIRTKDLRQIVTAVSDGAICAILAISHLRNK